MKIVQSFWSRPNGEAEKEGVDTRQAGGWYHRKYYHMSLALSCLQLARYYEEVELVTDMAGKEMLIDHLGLPYTSVVVELDGLNEYHRDLWALGKLYAYSIQRRPFLHVDGDVFIWEKFSRKLTDCGAIAQHLEKGYPFYQKVMRQLDEAGVHMPPVIRQYRQLYPAIHAYNMGIAGGQDIDFFQLYTEEAFRFVNDNRACLDHIDVGPFNTIYEQVLFFCLLHRYNKTAGLYTTTTGERRVDRETKGIRNFVRAPQACKYIHLSGPAKKFPYYCDELENKLKSLHPQYYERIMDTKKSLLNCI